jgi:dTDP-4-dehydrorhamnose 3,5-epimerase-like enzyme
MNSNQPSRVPHQLIADSRGNLAPFDLDSSLLKNFNRIFLTSNLNLNEARGGHAHKEQRQLFFAIQGRFRITLESESFIGEFELGPEDDGILMEPMTWSTQTPLIENSVLMVFCSDHYDESDYIRNYIEFKTKKIPTKEKRE